MKANGATAGNPLRQRKRRPRAAVLPEKHVRGEGRRRYKRSVLHRPRRGAVRLRVLSEDCYARSELWREDGGRPAIDHCRAPSRGSTLRVVRSVRKSEEERQNR